MSDYYITNGLLQPRSLPDLSILPAYFQEAIFDGVDWHHQRAELEYLEKALELDCIFHNNDNRRKDMSQEEFEAYMRFSNAAINRTNSKPKESMLSRLLAKLGFIF